ncbi:hydrogen gas-evolving membrane-bound hydrogenase subunit E [Flavonifractor sp. An100]|uniref:hydrogen gas-evolving membrane-bound hydrogenase subunit E n=1 Tax=Flavonifractor sp. An100 TaxID=1965538 RepID=UPI001FA8E5AD|nr:hydrogen gas-evolving membrane-bound hydrogenase subunit E [Flavonifractor sp. An100]
MMKHDGKPQHLFDRFMRWAEGEDPNQDREVAEDPERAEFIEYLEYIDSHEFLDFGAYRLMRYRERKAKGITQPLPHSSGQGQSVVISQSRIPGRRYRPGRLRSLIRLYRIASIFVAIVMMVTLLGVVLVMPQFGDPDAPAVNEVSERYLEQGVEETGAINAVTGMILDYRAFDTFGESTVLFAAAMSVILLLRHPGRPAATEGSGDLILHRMGMLILPAVMMFGIYVILNGHLSPGGGFSGGTVLGCGLILSALILGRSRMEILLPSKRITKLTVICLLAYGVMKGYSFFTGANHIGWDIPKGTPGAIFSGGFLLPLNICVGIIVGCTMYTFYTLFAGKEE